MTTPVPNQIAKVGDVTMIYQDPITRKNEEGLAHIVEICDRRDNGDMIFGMVEFLEDELPRVADARQIFTRDSADEYGKRRLDEKMKPLVGAVADEYEAARREAAKRSAAVTK